MSAAVLSSSPLPDNVFIIARRPPPDETREQLEARMEMERRAEEVSRQIDETLRSQRQFLQKKREAVKILLLGMFNCFYQTWEGNLTHIHCKGKLRVEKYVSSISWGFSESIC